MRKTIRQTRRDSITGTTASTLGSLHKAESEQALGRSASSSVCEYAGAVGRDTSLFCEVVGTPLVPHHAESSSVHTFTHEPCNSAPDFRREGTQHSPMIVDGFTRCSFGGVSDAGLVIPNVLPSGMSSVQSSSAAERAKFAMVGPANGCSRGANESMSEILVTSISLPFGEDYGDRRECTLEALTLNVVSGAAVPVTLHTHLPGDPCPAHSIVVDGTRVC